MPVTCEIGGRLWMRRINLRIVRKGSDRNQQQSDDGEHGDGAPSGRKDTSHDPSFGRQCRRVRGRPRGRRVQVIAKTLTVFGGRNEKQVGLTLNAPQKAASRLQVFSRERSRRRGL